MATFSKIENNIVVNTIEVSDNVATTEQNGINFLKDLYKDSEAQWVQTFTDGTRKHYAGIGYIYSLKEDAFIPPKPYPSWVLKKPEYVWESPVGDPPETYTKNLKQRDGITPLGDFYVWNDLHQRWEIKD
tara:strand:- start:49 stop:438 length:390 start_codon:yes stop_codon:yes gene_type:complete